MMSKGHRADRVSTEYLVSPTVCWYVLQVLERGRVFLKIFLHDIGEQTIGIILNKDCRSPQNSEIGAHSPFMVELHTINFLNL